MFAHNKNICLKSRNICFAKFIDYLKTTSQVNKFASQFAKCEARIRTLLNSNMSTFCTKTWKNKIRA